MKIQQIRNATIRIECAGKHFLIDPWFQKKGTGMSAPSPDPEKAKIPSPTTELPFSVEQIMEGIDAMIVTHIHPDHFDPETAAMLDKNIPVFAANEETKAQIEGFGYTSVMVLKDEGTDFDGVVLIRTEAMHGVSPDQAAGPVCGVILQAAGEPVLYVAGDTVYYQGVERALEQYRPDVVVLNACGAELMGLGRLIMGAEDVLKVCEAAPDAAIIASHMDAVNHATVSRAELRDFLKKHGKDGRVFIPEDGECLAFSRT